ncbi:hypothetical protein TNCV_3568271 [Trichonephila clavipes]|nr:hypothetical protein TNCV_3568271 [Trichonephila clavipes]
MQQKSEHHGTKSAVILMLELTTPSYGLLPNLLSRDRPQFVVCNTISTMDCFPPKDDRATANILYSNDLKMS